MSTLAYQYPVFQPAMRIIQSITNASPAVITTTFNHQYKTGYIVRLYIPQGYGMLQANQLTGAIVVTGDTTFVIDIDTTNFEAFTTPGAFPNNAQYAQVVPIGNVNDSIYLATINALPYQAT